MVWAKQAQVRSVQGGNPPHLPVAVVGTPRLLSGQIASASQHQSKMEPLLHGSSILPRPSVLGWWRL